MAEEEVLFDDVYELQDTIGKYVSLSLDKYFLYNSIISLQNKWFWAFMESAWPSVLHSTMYKLLVNFIFANFFYSFAAICWNFVGTFIVYLSCASHLLPIVLGLYPY